MSVKERITKLQVLLEKNNIDIYIIPTADFHNSEYVHNYFKEREFMSGFTGSAGTLIVTKKQAGLWTDGRYFIQAENQLKDSGIVLYRMGEENVFSIEEYINHNLPMNGVLGADGRMITAYEGKKWQEICANKQATFNDNVKLVNELWDNRPEYPQGKVFILEEKWCGESRDSKLGKIREFMKEVNADAHLLASLDDIAWLLNIRGNDIPCNPVTLSYLYLTMNEVHLFIDESKLDEKTASELGDVILHPYNDIYDFLGNEKGSVLYDPQKINYSLYQKIQNSRIEKENPEILMKAIKNDTEISNLRLAHIYDGLAITRFIYWLKNEIGKQDISEVSAIEYLEKCREENYHYLHPSFSAIGAYNSNAAMMHYNPSLASTATLLQPSGFYLIDSGGQYYEGTTDITRTICLGQINDEWKKHYTLVLKGMLRLSMAKFLYGCSGMQLDILSRGALWDIGIDYKSGTGHGVGYLLNVHEAPNGFRWRVVPERNDSCVLESGMVTTVEPGVYIDGSHGIRIENELVCQQAEKNEYGQFMNFETITVCPIDLDAVDKTLLDEKEINFLNCYHEHVYNTLAEFLSDEQKTWLKKETRSL